MKNLLTTVLYVFKTYPKKDELSSARLILLIFLIDWKFAVDNGQQFTEAKWVYENFGPFSKDILALVKKRNDIFKIVPRINSAGETSERLTFESKSIHEIKTFEAKSVADFIMQNTYSMTWSEFMELIYSTYPIMSNSKNTELNLLKDSVRFKQRQH